MPKCRNCGKTFDQVRFLQKYCLDDICLKKWIEKTKEDQWQKKKKKLKNDLITIQELIKSAQIIFNQYIRIRDKGLNCISCQKIPKKENAGHYFNANNHWSVRFDERNVHLQCEHCNTYLSGNLIEYRENLINKIGLSQFEELSEKAKETRKFTKEEINEIMRYYKSLIKSKKNQ
jgi:hypothetical protein